MPTDQLILLAVKLRQKNRGTRTRGAVDGRTVSQGLLAGLGRDRDASPVSQRAELSFPHFGDAPFDVSREARRPTVWAGL